MRYEIKDIQPPTRIKRCMELQAEAERVKRGKVLKSEGEKTSMINVGEGYKQSRILEGQGKAQQITQEARSVVETISSIGESLKTSDENLSEEALKMRLSEQYVKTLHEIFKEANIVVLPENTQKQIESGQDLCPSTLTNIFSVFKKAVGVEGLPDSPEALQRIVAEGTKAQSML